MSGTSTSKTIVPYTPVPLGSQCTAHGLLARLSEGRTVFVAKLDGHSQGGGAAIEFEADISDTERSRLEFQLSREAATVMVAMLLATGAVSLPEIERLAITMLAKRLDEGEGKP